jgi:4-amino-4-deoxy-L-arabinose transferase-like glycosyltransferase
LTLKEQLGVNKVKPGESRWIKDRQNLLYLCLILLFLHSACMLYRLGELPSAPVIGDEVTINDPAIALSRGQGLIAPSFADSAFGLDQLYAHFPPVYIWTQSLAFRALGVSAYSLRSTTTVMGILACALFLFIVRCICRWKLADPVIAGFAACLYALNASVISLHRVARMDSMVEFFALASLFFVLAGIFCPFGNSAHNAELGNESCKKRVALLFAGAISAGLCIATHPEGLTAILPILLLVLFAAPVRGGWKAMLLMIGAIIPVVIWMIAYGSRWKEAILQMRAIMRDITPQPGIVRYAHDLLRKSQLNIGLGMRAALFFLCLFVLGLLLIRWVVLRRSEGRAAHPEELERTQLLLAKVFALAALLSLFLLIWFISASITRYEVMYPIYLLGLVMALRDVSLNKTGRRIAVTLSSALVLAQLIAIAVYFEEDGEPPARFDNIVAMIPSGSRIAVTPKMWLAFVQNGRPVTLLYLGYDGRKAWSAGSRNPLQRFDAIVIDESFVDERHEYSPYAQAGRTERDFHVGSDVVYVYLSAK